MEGFAFTHQETVRFRDVDAMAHVNNAVYATYVEQARMAYLRHLGLLRGPLQTSMILARLEIDFRAPLGPGAEVEIGVRAARLGRRSFDLEYRVEAGGRLCAEARSVLVAYDYERQEPVALSDEWRQALMGEAVPA